MTANIRELSKKNYNPSKRRTYEEIQTGCLQRIADATELIAKDHDRLQRRLKIMEESRDYWYRESESWKQTAFGMQRKYAAMKGVVTKLKKKLAK